MDWAKHRKHKAAAKVHVALDLISFIPIRVVTDSANHHDGSYMSELCGNMKPGDIAVMDRAYVDYVQLNTLTEKGVFWVTRSKSNMKAKLSEVVLMIVGMRPERIRKPIIQLF